MPWIGTQPGQQIVHRCTGPSTHCAKHAPSNISNPVMPSAWLRTRDACAMSWTTLRFSGGDTSLTYRKADSPRLPESGLTPPIAAADPLLHPASAQRVQPCERR
jgi:hypothetical protein